MKVRQLEQISYTCNMCILQVTWFLLGLGLNFFYLDTGLKVPNTNVLVLNVVHLCNHFKAVLIPFILLFMSRAIKHNAI